MFERTGGPIELDYEDEVDPLAEDQDEVPHKSPVGLLSASRSLARRWQALGEAQAEPPSAADDHYLSAISRLAEQAAASDQEMDFALLAEIGRLITRNIRTHLRATRRAHRQLTRELAALAEIMERDDLAETASRQVRADREETPEQ